MNAVFLSSGNILADRRAHYATLLAQGGEWAAAADLMDQALESAPDWAAGWLMLGTYRHEAGEIGPALAAWDRAAALDPSGALGAQMRLAAHGIKDVEVEAQTGYVEALFDNYATHFEDSLVGKLNYVVPDRLHQLLTMTMEACGIAQFARAIDLGCGTGLMGERLRRHVSHLSGVDLSAGMVSQARRKGVYDALAHGGLLTHLGQVEPGIDLITAADVLLYCGALEPVLKAVHSALAPGGIFAFSLEEYDGEEPYVLRPSLRYAHGRGASRAALRASGFDIVCIAQTPLREDKGEPVAGILFVVRKPDVTDGDPAALDAPRASRPGNDATIH